MYADSLRDPVALTQALVRCASVTPADAGAMDLVQGWLEALGFTCRRMPFGEVQNLYARRGTASPNLCFAGHVDVVPPGEAAAWSADPFGGEVRPGVDGEVLLGRGVVDMKGGVAAWVAAVARSDASAPGSLSLLITGDEEGVAVNGTRKVVAALQAEGERIDACVVGEPTNVAALGDMVKIGRRGSFHAWVTVEGVAGHAAYPHRAANPVPVLIDALHRMTTAVLDEGHPGFQPSDLQVTELEVGNPAANVIPPRARGRLNIRFNPTWTGEALTRWMEEVCAEAARGFAGSVRVEARTSGEAFVTPPGAFSAMVADAVREATGREPELSTSGGTSDARFIRALCPVVEFGLVGATMHKPDEQAPVADLRALTSAYAGIIRRMSAEPATPSPP